MVLVQKWPFFQPFFCAIQVRKVCFKKFQNEKAPLYAIKTKSSKIRKSDIFPKGLPFDMGQNWPCFNLFFFQAIQARKMSFTIFQNEKWLFYAIKTRSSKVKKIDIFPKGLTHGFSPKMSICPISLFYAIQARKMTLTKFQNEKAPFQAIKTRSS